MSPDRNDDKPRDREAVRTAQALRLVQAFSALESSAVREALLVLVEHLGEIPGQRRPR